MNCLEASIEDLQKAMALEPSNASAHNNLGLSYFETGQYEKAMEDQASNAAASAKSDKEVAAARESLVADFRASNAVAVWKKRMLKNKAAAPASPPVSPGGAGGGAVCDSPTHPHKLPPLTEDDRSASAASSVGGGS